MNEAVTAIRGASLFIAIKIVDHGKDRYRDNQVKDNFQIKLM